jgi:hypothetical protein
MKSKGAKIMPLQQTDRPGSAQWITQDGRRSKGRPGSASARLLPDTMSTMEVLGGDSSLGKAQRPGSQSSQRPGSSAKRPGSRGARPGSRNEDVRSLQVGRRKDERAQMSPAQHRATTAPIPLPYVDTGAASAKRGMSRGSMRAKSAAPRTTAAEEARATEGAKAAAAPDLAQTAPQMSLETRLAGLDEGLLSLSPPRILVYMENPYKRNK